MTQIKPFDFTKLKKLNRKQIEIEKKLLSYLQGVSHLSEVFSFFNQSLTQDLGVKSTLKYHSYLYSSYKHFIADSAQFSVTLILSYAGEKWILRVDSLLVLKAIDLILGGSQEFPKQVRSLSASEEGVFQYLILKLLAKLPQVFGEENPESLSLHGIVYGNDALDHIQSLDQAGCHFRYQLKMGKIGGAVDLFIPETILETVVLKNNPLEEPSLDGQSLVRIKDQLGYLATELNVELGHVVLQNQDLRQLEEGDVILFDETMVNLKNDASDPLSGRVILRVGEDRDKGLLAELISGAKPAMMKVLDFYGGD